MNGIYRGGNGRLLAKSLDQSTWPVAVLGGEGEILYVNSALCAVAEADSTRLVGQRCCWQIAPDDMPFGRLLFALAPPQCVLAGETAFREIPWPLDKPNHRIGQHFIPLAGVDPLDPSGSLFMVLFRENARAKSTAGESAPANSKEQVQVGELLVKLRSQWNNLDGLLPLLGSSPAIQTAMQRVQLAVTTSANVFLWGPRGVGKAEVLRAVFSCRLREHNIPLASGQVLPLDCALLDEQLLEAMLEVFLARLRPGVPTFAQQLTLERLDQLPTAAASILNRWLDENETRCCVMATSQVERSALDNRGATWKRLLSRIGIIDAHLPPLAHRREDIPILLEQTLAMASARANRTPPSIGQAASELLCAYPWPENVVELQRSMIELLPLVVMTTTIQPHHLPLAMRIFSGSAMSNATSVFEPVKLDGILEEVERMMIQRAIKLSPRNRAQVARWLGISRPRLLRRIVELGLDKAATVKELDAPDSEL